MTARRWRVALPLALAAGRLHAAPAQPAVDAARLPAPGSYRLARIMAAPDGAVLDAAGRPQRLHALLRGRLSVLSPMYTYCRDPLGCPRAWAAMQAVQTALQQDAALAARAQLVSLSFDPTNDTPPQMRAFGGERAQDARVRWHFITTAGVAQLLPILEGLGQEVSVERDERGHARRTLNHLLKLFLVDATLQVREIYSVATLAPEALLNDLRTLALERA